MLGQGYQTPALGRSKPKNSQRVEIAEAIHPPVLPITAFLSIIYFARPRNLKEFSLDHTMRAQFKAVLRGCMPPRVPNPALSRLFVLPWLVTWVLTIPLFHVHALDAQESRFRTQAVLLHTVFSPDLPGEYAPRTVANQSRMPENQQALSSHFPHYSEFAVGPFSEDDTKRKNGIQTILYAQFFSLRSCPPGSTRYVIPDLASPTFLLLASSVSPRSSVRLLLNLSINQSKDILG